MHRGGGGKDSHNCFNSFYLILKVLKRVIILCRSCPPFVFEPMTGCRRCGMTRGTLLSWEGQASTSYRIRFTAGYLTLTLRQLQLWLIGTFSLQHRMPFITLFKNASERYHYNLPFVVYVEAGNTYISTTLWWNDSDATGRTEDPWPQN